MRRLSSPLVPAVLACVPVALWLTTSALNRVDSAADAVMPFQMAFVFSIPLAALGLAVWLLALSRTRWQTKLAVSGVVALATFTAFASIRSLEFDAGMRPHAEFRWEKSQRDALQEYAAAELKDPSRADLTPRPGDSPAFRGGPGYPVPAGLKPVRGLELAWSHPTGAGHGGVAVAGDSVITLEQRDGDEAVVCLNRATGATRWVTPYAAEFKTSEPMGGGGPRTTPTIADGKVVTLGATGILTCLDGATGKILWQADTLKDSSATLPQWAISGSPLVLGNQVIVQPGVDPENNTNQAVAAYDLATGKRLWAKGNHAITYASPMSATLCGIPQVVIFDLDGVAGLNPADGSELWRSEWKTAMGGNAAQPCVIAANLLYVSSEKSNGGALLELSQSAGKWDVKRLWQNRAISARFSTPVELGGAIYGLTDGRLVCLDAATGQRRFAEGSFGAGQLLPGVGQLVISGESGAVSVVEANGREFAPVATLKVFDARTWNMPAMTERELFVRNHRAIACVRLVGE